MIFKRIGIVNKKIVSDEDATPIKVRMADCVIAWAQVEIAMSTLFSVILETDDKLSYIIWDSIRSFESKLEALTNNVSYRIKDETIKRVWPKLAGKISKYAKKRNEIAHSCLTYCDGKYYLTPYFSIGRIQENQAVFFTIDDLDKRILMFYELEEALSWVLLLAMREKKGSEEPLPPMPCLINRFQNLSAQIPEVSG